MEETDIHAEKIRIRKMMRGKLLQFAQNPFEKQRADSGAVAALVRSAIYRDAGTVLTFVSKFPETDTSGLIAAAHADRKKVAVPRTYGNDMTFFYLDPARALADQLEQGAFGIAEPLETLPALDARLLPPDTLIVVPGLAFSCNGGRLGHGKGFYDRFISVLFRENLQIHVPAAIAGFCYSMQILPQLPVEAHDIIMTHIVSENGVTVC